MDQSTHRRYFEDLSEGDTHDLGATLVTREMILDFAHEFDPLPFHVDEDAARRSLLGGLSSSGWQTGALTLRMLADVFLARVVALGGLGFSNLKWKRPVMVGDTISATATIASLRPSDGDPGRGIVILDIETRNQRGESVMALSLANLVATRPARGEGS